MVEMAPISRALNGVKSNGQARAAAGAALKYAHTVYDVIPMIGDRDLREGARRALDTARVQLEGRYNSLPEGDGNRPVGSDWAALRRAIERVYLEGGGAEATAAYVPSTSNLSILLSSIAGAPVVFLGAVGGAARAVTEEAGKAAGGLFAGLGWITPILLLVVAALVALRFGLLRMVLS